MDGIGAGMTEAGNQDRQQWERRLAWQSQVVLGAVLLPVIAALAAQIAFLQALPALILTGLLISAAFALLVWKLRAGTAGAAIAGGLITTELYFAVPGWRTVLWVVLALFLMTFGATRFGRSRKERIGAAESRHGRSASQVAANLGVAAWMGILVCASHFFSVSAGILSGRAVLIALIAAAAEATADTLSSELGQVLGGEPFLVTTFRRVAPGTDGAVSLAGTAAGCLGALAAVTVAALVLPLSSKMAALALAGGVFGLFFDTLLGATLERSGWLNNDSVNFLSTLAAAIVASLLTLA